MSELVYDCRNRLVRAGGITYTYDAENIRIKAETADYVEEYVTDTVSASLSRVLTMTVYEEKAGVTGTTTTYLYGQGLISEETEGNYLYHHYNNLGSTMKLTDGEGQVVESYTYGVYGELLSGDETLTRFLYNGRCGVSTEENGLYYMRQRYYNPQIKRFINQDILTGSLDNSQSLNRYSYVQGNPVSYTDPFGLSPVNGLFTDPNNIHSTLTVLGFTPGPGGVAADLLDAGIYLVEGDLSGTALAFLAVFCGSVALTGKAAKAGKAMNKANKLSNTSQLVNKASDMMSASSNFMKTAMNGSDVTQVVKTARQGRVIDKLKSAVTSAGNKFKSSKLYLNNIGAVDTRILNPSKWDDVVMDGGVLKTGGSSSTPKTLYHYTNEKGMTGIVESKKLNPSLKANNPKDARFGDGQYLSDIKPDNQTPVSLAQRFIHRPNRYKYTHYVEIDISDLEVIKGREGVYVIPNSEPLDLMDRIISTGSVGIQ